MLDNFATFVPHSHATNLGVNLQEKKTINSWNMKIYYGGVQQLSCMWTDTACPSLVQGSQEARDGNRHPFLSCALSRRRQQEAHHGRHRGLAPTHRHHPVQILPNPGSDHRHWEPWVHLDIAHTVSSFMLILACNLRGKSWRSRIFRYSMVT